MKKHDNGILTFLIFNCEQRKLKVSILFNRFNRERERKKKFSNRNIQDFIGTNKKNLKKQKTKRRENIASEEKHLISKKIMYLV